MLWSFDPIFDHLNVWHVDNCCRKRRKSFNESRTNQLENINLNVHKGPIVYIFIWGKWPFYLKHERKFGHLTLQIIAQDLKSDNFQKDYSI